MYRIYYSRAFSIICILMFIMIVNVYHFQESDPFSLPYSSLHGSRRVSPSVLSFICFCSFSASLILMIIIRIGTENYYYKMLHI